MMAERRKIIVSVDSLSLSLSLDQVIIGTVLRKRMKERERGRECGATWIKCFCQSNCHGNNKSKKPAPCSFRPNMILAGEPIEFHCFSQLASTPLSLSCRLESMQK